MDATSAALVDYALGVSYAQLPPSTVEACKIRLLDTLGCVAAGYSHPVALAAREMAHGYKTDAPATVLGSNRKVAPEMAAFANGVMLRLLDMSDMYRVKSGGHPSDVIATVMAAAEAAHAGGEDLMLGMAIAYEIYCACCDSVDLNSKGWDQPVYAAVGGALAAGRLLGLDRDQMGHALALALVPNMTLYQTRHGELSAWKGCAAANAARNALFAVLLAQKGFTGPSAAFEGKGGLWDVVGRFDWAGQLQGVPSRIARTHLKCFPVCYHGQSAIWAALGVRAKVALRDVDRIRVDTYRTAFNMMASDPSRWAPATHETADHSLPFVVATALRDGAVDYASFADERLRDPEMLRLMQTVSVHEDAQFTADSPPSFTSRVTAITKSGQEVVNVVKYPKGHDQDPLTRAEVEAKFMTLFRDYGSKRKARALIDMVNRLESLPDLTELFAKFKYTKRGAPAGH